MFTLGDLEKIVQERAGASPETSYTATLAQAGLSRVSKKFGEEAVEVVIAAMEGQKQAIVSETADLLYHLTLLLHLRNISFDEVLAALKARTSTSGLEEKRQRDLPKK